MPQSKTEGYIMVFEITEDLKFDHDLNKKQSIFVIYTEFKDSSHMFD